MDVFFQGVEVTVMGFIVVIAVLAFICFVLMIFNFIANLENKKAKDTIMDFLIWGKGPPQILLRRAFWAVVGVRGPWYTSPPRNRRRDAFCRWR